MVLLSRAIRVRRFQALSKQDIAQFLIVGAQPSAPCAWVSWASVQVFFLHVLKTRADG